jgi:hypothetical protein
MKANNPTKIEISLRREDVDAVIREYEAAHPGKSFVDMTPREFADRMMAKLLASGWVSASIVTEEDPT